MLKVSISDCPTTIKKYLWECFWSLMFALSIGNNFLLKRNFVWSFFRFISCPNIWEIFKKLFVWRKYLTKSSKAWKNHKWKSHKILSPSNFQFSEPFLISLVFHFADFHHSRERQYELSGETIMCCDNRKFLSSLHEAIEEYLVLVYWF